MTISAWFHVLRVKFKVWKVKFKLFESMTVSLLFIQTWYELLITGNTLKYAWACKLLQNARIFNILVCVNRMIGNYLYGKFCRGIPLYY